MTFEAGFVISLPALELRTAQISASVSRLDALDDSPFSPLLRDALNLVDRCLPQASSRWLVARPEMFTDGVTLDWLNQRCGGVEDHVCLSDGSTVRLLPGFRNHVFFYGLSQARHVEALARLERRTPEVLAQVVSQFNSAMRFRWKRSHVSPETFTLLRDEAPVAAPELRRLVIDRHSVEVSVARTLAEAPAALGEARFAVLHYLRLSECALGNPDIGARLQSRIAQTFVDPTQAVVFVPPRGDFDAAGSLHRLLSALLGNASRLPGIAAGANLFVAANDLPLSALRAAAARRSLETDDCCDFWRHPPDFYEAFDAVKVFAREGRHQPARFEALSRVAYGANVSVEWLRAPHRQTFPG